MTEVRVRLPNARTDEQKRRLADDLSCVVRARTGAQMSEVQVSFVEALGRPVEVGLARMR